MSIVIFDTETVSLNKPFAYNVGYVIVDNEQADFPILCKREFVVKQIWHNLELFNTAYYAKKRPLYVSAMRGKRAKLEKFGYICQTMIRDFKNFNVTSAYAYNSSFDEKVFNFNCEWYKCSNPFDIIPIFDIRGYVHEFIAQGAEYKAFCEEHELFTENGNYSTTAEAVYKFCNQEPTFEEAHTALADAEIEWEILWDILTIYGAQLETAYEVKRTIEREQTKTLEILVNREPMAEFTYNKKCQRGDKIYLTKN